MMKIRLLALLLIMFNAYDALNFDSARKIELVINKPSVIKKPTCNDDIRFMHKMAWSESRGNSRITNRYGYMGLYQFSLGSVKAMWVDTFVVTRNESIEDRNTIIRTAFLNDTALQDTAMIRLIMYHEKKLSKYIDLYDGRYFHMFNGDSVYVTKYGILAAAHLGGFVNAKKFFDSEGRRNPHDALGTSLLKYIRKFSDK